MLKAVLFDLDDTLLDWSEFVRDNWRALESRHLGAVYRYITSAGHTLPDFETFVDTFMDRNREVWIQASATHISPHIGRVIVDVAETLGVPHDALHMEACLDHYEWGVLDNTTVFPDVPPILDQFRARGLKLGIITNAAQPMRVRDRELRLHGLLDYFPDCRLAAADVGYLKPHPRVFETALELLGVRADEAVFVGDTPEADIAGAQGAGMLAVLRVKQPAAPLISGLIVPDGAINSLDELPAVLDDLFPGWRS